MNPQTALFQRRVRSAGFTLVELLVVIAIIGVLVALLLPAVQSAREAARRIHCGNNLKQMGLAVLNYESTNRTLPAGGITNGACCSAKSGPNWAITILPYIEQQDLHNRYDFTKFNEDPENAFVCELSVAAYICPSDIDTDQLERPAYGPGRAIDYHFGSYRASAGLGDGGQETWAAPKASGAFYVDNTRGAMHSVGKHGIHNYGQVRIAHIEDGGSNTLLIGERAITTVPRRRTFWAYPFSAFSMSEVTLESRILLRDYARCVNIGPSFLACTRGWSSMHPGAMLFVLCDGSVQSINESIDVNVLGELATIAGGEVTQLP